MIITFGLEHGYGHCDMLCYNTKTKQFHNGEYCQLSKLSIDCFDGRKCYMTWFILDPYNGEKINKKFLKKMYLEAIKNSN